MAEQPVGPRCGNNPNARLTDGDRKAVENAKSLLALKAAAEPYIDSAAWVDGDPLMEVIAAIVWKHCEHSGISLVIDDPRTIAAFAAAVARAHAAAASPAADQAALRKRIAMTLARTKLRPPYLHCLVMADAVLPELPDAADRAALERVRTVLETEAVEGRSALEYRGLIVSALMGAGAQQPGTPCERCGHNRQAHNISGCTACPGGWRADHQFTSVDQPPADPWSISYHQLGPARMNPNVCTCGLGPGALTHNEPPHAFNGRPKPGMPGAYGICTDCHHHQSAACHKAEEQLP